jgi:hypothetical protein
VFDIGMLQNALICITSEERPNSLTPVDIDGSAATARRRHDRP